MPFLILMEEKNLQTSIYSFIEEINLNVVNGVLSKIQFQIFLEKFYGNRYSDLIEKYKICKTSLTKCLLQTAMGMLWKPCLSGGQNRYLSDIDILKFKDYIVEASEDLNCVPTHVALNIALSLKQKRIKKAKEILQFINCPHLAAQIDDAHIPSKAWLKEFCNEFGIVVTNPQTIEQIRRMSCDIDGILSFFSDNSIVIDRHPCLILNMDETMLSGKKRFKVLCLKGGLPLTPLTKSLHVTGVVTISANGKCFDPMFIIPNKKTPNDLDTINHFITSSISGWMTKRLFLIYTIFIISQVQFYRFTLPNELQEEPILLIVDGHSSRISFYSNYLFHLFNIDLLILPAHSTHILQPFDVSIASPLKTEFNKQMQKINFDIEKHSRNYNQKISMKDLRKHVIDSFSTALKIVSTIDNLKSGFSSTGIFPIDPSIPLSSKYLLPSAIPSKRINPISGKFLNSDHNLKKLFELEFGRTIKDDDMIDDIKNFILEKYYTNSADGIALSKCPTILFKNENSIIQIT